MWYEIGTYQKVANSLFWGTYFSQVLQNWYLNSDIVGWGSCMAEAHSSMHKSPQKETCTSQSQHVSLQEVLVIEYTEMKSSALCTLTCTCLYFPECMEPTTWWLRPAREKGAPLRNAGSSPDKGSLPKPTHSLSTLYFFHLFFFVYSIGIIESSGHGELGSSQRPYRKWRDTETQQGPISSKMLLPRDKQQQLDVWI